MLSEPQKAQIAQLRAQIDQGKAEEALAALQTLQHEVEGPDAAEVFLVRGLAQSALGQAAAADKSFMTAYSIVRFGRDLGARRLLGQAAERVGQKDEAIGAWEAVQKEVPDDAEAKAALDRLRSAQA